MEEDDDSEDDWSRGGKATKGKKGAKGKKQGRPPSAKPAGSKAAAPAPVPAGAKGKAAATAQINAAVAAQLLSVDALTDKITEWLPEVLRSPASILAAAVACICLQPRVLADMLRPYVLMRQSIALAA